MKLTIGKKLALGFSAVILLMVISSAITYYRVTDLNDRVTTLVDDDFPTVRAVDQMLNGLNGTLAALRGYLILGSDSDQSAYLKAERQSSWDSIDSAMQQVTETYDNTSDPEDQKSFDIVQENLESFRTAQNAVETSAEEVFEKGNGDDVSEAISRLQSDAVPKSKKIREALRNLKRNAVARVDASREDMGDSVNLVQTTLILATLIAIVLATVVAFMISRKIISGVRVLLAGVEAVSEGDLTGEMNDVDTADEVGQLAAGFNKMVGSLRRLLSEARMMTGEVASSSSEIATGAQQQLSSLNQTATSLNEITTTAEEFKATMQEFADRARAVQEAADETTKRTAEGRTLTQESSARIEQVLANSKKAGKSVLSLSQQMQRIGEITATVNEIAEQTKLLALNASIEAARAGEDGRGFAVVATQVRELANQSKESASRIESLISNTQKSMQDVANTTQEGSRLSEDSVESVQQMSSAFKEIAQAIDQTREAMSQINTGARQQEEGITELVSSITEIDSASKESLAAAEQTQKSIVAIDQRIQSLSQTISRFKT